MTPTQEYKLPTKDWREGNKRGYKYIVIHHTATAMMSAERMKLSMMRTRITNRGNDHIPAHYIIGYQGDTLLVNELDKPVGAVIQDKNNNIEDVMDANLNGIHIEMVGNFENKPPTQEQYISLKKLIDELKTKYEGIEIKYHKDFQTKSCPGQYFDTGFMNKDYKKDKYTMFSLSRYYSPMQGQSRYYNGKTYEDDVQMNCGKSNINNDGCLYPADGKRLKDKDKYKVIACPPEYKLGTNIYLEGIGIVQCRDRGGAIQDNKLDVRCGLGEDALNNWNSCPTGTRKGYIVK